MVVYKRFQLKGFDWKNFGVLDRRLLMGDGRLRELVAGMEVRFIPQSAAALDSPPCIMQFFLSPSTN